MRTHEDPNAFVVRSRKIERVCDRTQPPVCLSDRHLRVVERCERPDQTPVDAGR